MKANIDIKIATQEVMKHPEIQKKTFSEALADKLKDFKHEDDFEQMPDVAMSEPLI